MELLGIPGQIKEHILKPISIKLDNIKSYKLTLNDPVLHKLRNIPNLGCDRWNPISSCYVIISISSYFLLNYVICISSLEIWREIGVLGHVLHNRKNPRSSLFNIVGVTAVEWPHETVAI